MTDTETKPAKAGPGFVGPDPNPQGDADAFAGISKTLFAEEPGKPASEEDHSEPGPSGEGEPAKPEGGDDAVTPDPDKAGDEPTPDDDGAGEERRLGIRALSDEQYAAVLRAKLPESVLNGLDDGNLIALADRMLAMRAEQDRAFEAYRTKARSGPEAAPTNENAKGAPARLPAPDLASVDFKRAADPVLKTLGLDDSDGAPVAAFGQQIYEAAVKATTDALRPLIERAEAKAVEAQRGHVEQMLSAARDELRSEWPQLADPKRYSEVRAVVPKVAPAYDDEPDMHKAAREVMRAAAYRVLGAPKPKADVDAKGKAPASNGQPSKPTGTRAKRSAPKTAAQKDAEAFDAATKRAGIVLR